ncbi:MAG: Gfo/Idh/MocA family oxidoreductase [Rubrivivax sp.]
MRSRLRVGLAGAGMVSAFHLPAWRALADQVELVAVADPDIERAQAAARQYGVPRAWRSLDDMLAGELLDAVDLMTPPHLHAEQCLAAAAAGVAVLCQKPLAPSAGQARQLIGAVGSRVRLMVHENWRFRPHYRQVRRWLDEGRIGELRSAELQTLSCGLLPDAEGRMPALVRQPLLATLPRMMVAEVLVHHLDIVCWLAGPARVVQASLQHAVSQISGESAATIVLACAGGARFEVGGDMAAARALPTLRDELALTGSLASITLRGTRLHLSGDAPEASMVDLEADYADSYIGAIGHFVYALRNDHPFEATLEDHLDVLELVDEAYRQARMEGIE